MLKLSYSAYGLGLESAMPLPELQPFEGKPDAFISFSGEGPGSLELPGERSFVRISPRQAIFSIRGFGAYVVREGSEIVMRIDPEIDHEIVRPLILGRLMAALLHQRGMLVLHAGSVEIGEKAAIFVGAPGAGKSSLTAAFYSLGYRVLSDDNLPVNMENGDIRVFPAFPQLRISAEVAEALDCDTQSIRILNDAQNKRGLRVDKGFSPEPRSPGGVYVVEEGDSLEIERVKSKDSVIELVRHSFPTRLPEQGDARHLIQCRDLAAGTPIYRLKRPRSLSNLVETARRVAEHFGSVAGLPS